MRIGGGIEGVGREVTSGVLRVRDVQVFELKTLTPTLSHPRFRVVGEMRVWARVGEGEKRPGWWA